jgi:dihydrofolate reductase
VAKLIYSMLTSLDGYVADEQGNFDWAAPDEEVHAAVNELQSSVGTMLGRRMYDVLVPWETWDTLSEPDVIKDFASLWRGADKATRDLSIGGPELAGRAFKAGLVDERRFASGAVYVHYRIAS